MFKSIFRKLCQLLPGSLVALLIAGLATSFTLMPVQAYAQDYYRSNSVNAGFYLRVPFGPTKKNEDKMKYGLRLNMTREVSYSPGWRSHYSLDNRQTFNADIMSLNFSENGLRNLSIAGRKTFTYQDGLLRFEGEEKEEGTHPVVGGLAIVGGLILLGGLAFKVACG